MVGKSRAGTKRLRLDELLVRRGLALDLKQAAALILRGVVLVENQRIHQVGTQVKADAGLRVKETASRYVSRAGGKLAAALGTFQVRARGRICWDLGASTGGFTDCLLQEGAARVYAVDVGRGQLHWKLQKDERVIRRDGINVRYLDPEEIGEKPDLITVDLSFISLRLVLPGLTRLSPATIVALVKPQFEARRSEVEAGGLITDDALRTRVIERLRGELTELGVEVLADVPSSIAGQKGNREHFFLCRV